MTQDDMAEALGVGRSTVQKLERGHAYAKVLPVHREAARILGWSDDSVESVLAGGDPTRVSGRVAVARQPDSSPVEAGVDALLDDLTARVKGALLGGQLADATAVPMGDGDGSVVIIWKEGEQRELAPDRRRKLERQWARLQRAAHDILADGEDQEEQ